jgi:alkanesulfonate monooxygenase SsuD/methylene tetrahydromethanopterin reductase-like flavin-dependent oxidoreductase (luciferase family)
VPLDVLQLRRRALQAAWREAGRDSETAPLSFMHVCVAGRDRAEVAERVRRMLAVTGSDDTVAEVIDDRPSWLIGTVDELAERLRALEAAGVSRVMLQHLDHADTEMVAVLGEVAASMGSVP